MFLSHDFKKFWFVGRMWWDVYCRGRNFMIDLLFPSSHPLTSTGVISRRGKSTGRSMSELIAVGPVMREKTPVLQVSHQIFCCLHRLRPPWTTSSRKSFPTWLLKNTELLELLYSSLKAFIRVECL